jgi:polysaccharide biosynthesis protein PslG
MLALALASALFPLPASAAQKGIQTDMTWGVSNTDRDRTIADVQDLGAEWMRVTMAWHSIETSKGTYSNNRLSHYDNALTKAAQSGAKLIVTVYTSPSWASGRAEDSAPPLDPADYADFIRFAANRWGDKVDAWEIWNEQNSSSFWSTGPSPAGYANLLKAAYPAVKSVDPSALVLYGGVSHNDYRFIERSYAAEPNLGDYYDVMATHPYPTSANLPPEYTWLESDGRLAVRSFPSYREIRNVMVANGDDKPLWFTEFGWSTNTLAGLGISESTQAAYYTRAMQCLEQDPYVDVAIWYIYRNHAWANDANTWLDQLGLVRTDFTRKLAYNAFKSYTPGSVGCTYRDLTAPAAEPDPAGEPVAEPAGTDEPDAEPEPEPDPVVSTSVTRRVALRLYRSTSARTSARTTESQETRAALRVRGRVSKADRGRIALSLTCRGRGGEDWQRAVKRHADVRQTGRFTRRIKPRSGGKCRLRAEYRSGGERLARSRLVRFKT